MIQLIKSRLAARRERARLEDRVAGIMAVDFPELSWNFVQRHVKGISTHMLRGIVDEFENGPKHD